MDVAERLRLAGGPASEVVELARWVCLASRIEPHLLRRARLRFMARTSASLEADLWFGPLVQTRSARFITFYPDIINHLRQEIAQNASMMTSAWQLVRESHGYLPELVRLEEELVWLAIQDGPQRERQLNEQLRPVLKALLAGERKGLARWAVGALPRLPASAQTETARLVQMVSEAQLYGGWMQLLESGGDSGEALSEEARALLFQSMERVEAGIQLFGDRLEVSEPPAVGAQLIRVPATNPRVIDLSWTATDGSKEARLTWPRPNSSPTQKVNEPQRANALLRQLEPPVLLTTIAGDRSRVVSQRAAVEQLNEIAAPFLVTLFDNGLKPVGTGVLIDERHIITTEHNVLQSYEGTQSPLNPILRNKTLIQIRFPLLQDQRSIVARNLRSTASDSRFPKLENLALLELDGRLPAGAHPAQLGNLTEPSGRSLVGFAESPQKPDGSWARFDLLASAGGYYALKPHANIALADYSGSPLIDSESGVVFGIFCLREESLAVLRPVLADFLHDESANKKRNNLPDKEAPAKLWIFNTSLYLRKGHITTLWQPIYEATRIPPDELIVRDEDGNILPSQVDALHLFDPTLAFSLEKEIQPVKEDYSTPSSYVTLERGTAVQKERNEPQLKVDGMRGQERKIFLGNHRLEIWLELYPEPLEDGRNWYSGSATSVRLDGLEILDAFNAQLDLVDNERRCMQLDQLQLFDRNGDQLKHAQPKLINDRYQLISSSTGPVRASITIVSQPFIGYRSGSDAYQDDHNSYRLYRTISLYNDTTYLTEELKVVGTKQGSDGSFRCHFNVRYFAYIDMGLDPHIYKAKNSEAMPKHLALSCNWAPYQAYGFATDVEISKISSPHPSFPNQKTMHKTFSWELAPSLEPRCLHLFSRGTEDLEAHVGRVWHEVVDNPLVAMFRPEAFNW